MNKSQKILSDITIYSKYAKYIPELKRRETWSELVDRNKNMHIKKFPELKTEIENYYTYVYGMKILPSMRSLQFAGEPIELNNSRINNCSYLPIDHYKSFSEVMFLLLSGCGVGYSIQFSDIAKLGEIKKPIKKKKYIIEDSIIGWSQAVRELVKSYFTGSSKPVFNFSQIRPKGSILKTSGGKAPGPEPLIKTLFNIERIFENKQSGERLKSIECHSILCHIADCVLSGGIRRSAMIALFSFDDEDMISCKSGNWWELNPHFARANNSVVINRNRCKKKDFEIFFERIKASDYGEPGILWTNDPKYGANPCNEISLRPYTFCNLVEINANTIESKEDFLNRCEAASFIATLQASYTDFVYLRDFWEENTKKDALIGVGITGIASNTIEKSWLIDGANVVNKTNKNIAKKININPAARTTTVKPSGTTSIVLGTSSGIHAWYDKYYIRRMRLSKDESLYKYLSANYPDLVEDEIFNPKTTSVLSIPQCSPENACLRDESIEDFLQRINDYNVLWVQSGHNSGPNNNNVSATVSVKEEEWDILKKWMWENRFNYSGISTLKFDNHKYVQTPFESITKKQYENMFSKLKDIDLSKIIETEDNTDLQGELACSGDSCEIK